jgi:ribosomal protein S18 acetylase RimI-like enzyme
MRRDELDIAVEWAALEGWNPGLHDAGAFYAADPNGFFVGLLDGEPIASISAVAYEPGFAFVGFYIVKPEYRGRGYGIQIWNRALAYVRGRNVGLDGVPAQQANYERSGFKLAYRNLRHEGRTAAQPDGVPGLADLAAIPREDIDAYDRRHFPTARGAFLEAWLALPDSAGLAVQRDGRLAGYGVIRRCRNGFKVGPLFADDGSVAETLFNGLTGRVEPDAPVFLDVPEANAAAVELARRQAMTLVFETARMYTQEPPEMALAGVYGVTTLELG